MTSESSSSSGDTSPAAQTKPSTSESTEVEEAKVTKRRKLENGSAATQSVSTARKDKSDPANSNRNRRTGVPFQRIQVDKIQYADPRLKDNTFAARGARHDDYGSKASADLIVTRGAGFRKEKNKKKRGSYRGGEITMQSHSIKFE